MGARIPYSTEELDWIKARRKLSRRDLHRAFCEHFDRVVTQDAIKALCLRKGWKTGRTGRYPPGSVPANKGKSQPYNANSARTQFKKGLTPPNTKHLGHERIDKAGYVWISIAEENPHTGYGRHYVHKHRLLWEKANGPIPEGMVLKCLSDDKSNSDPSNFALIPRAMLPRLNGRFGRDYDNAPPELKPSIFRTADLEHQAREARRRRAKHKGKGKEY